MCGVEGTKANQKHVFAASVTKKKKSSLVGGWVQRLSLQMSWADAYLCKWGPHREIFRPVFINTPAVLFDN